MHADGTQSTPAEASALRASQSVVEYVPPEERGAYCDVGHSEQWLHGTVCQRNSRTG
ncbi:hypothetical protein GCM10009716_18390 [Streptomyces sodiiphilus]|uniref:Uncharacterized protein n=1 Tax=Streptomyces sodiiphilus TaxID=226217 RepID=A0ABN2P2U1_9ACTN